MIRNSIYPLASVLLLFVHFRSVQGYLPNCYIYGNSEEQCIQCNPGFAVQLQNLHCLSNQGRVDKCAFYDIDDNTCLQCQDGYALNRQGYCAIPISLLNSTKSFCIRFDGNDHLSPCTKYRWPFTITKYSTTMVLEVLYRYDYFGCAVYDTSVFQCVECAVGFKPVNEACVSLIDNLNLNPQDLSLSNCLVKKAKEPTKCIQCIDGYEFKPNTTLNCKTYLENSHICASCLPGYKLNAATKKCDLITDKCIKGNTVCEQCEYEYYLNRTTSMSCLSKLLTNDTSISLYCEIPQIIQTINYICEKCLDGYYLQADLQNCSIINSNCIKGTEQYKCQMCQENYLLGPYFIYQQCKAVPTISNCKVEKPFPDKQAICLICMDRYYPKINHTQCGVLEEDSLLEEELIPHCLAYGFNYLLDELVCQQCEVDYYLDASDARNRTCFQIKDEDNLVIQNCLIGDSNFDLCHMCVEGFLRDSQKKNCHPGPIDNCIRNSVADKDCSECSIGYVLVKKFDGNRACMDQEIFQNCSEFDEQAAKCVKCDPGFKPVEISPGITKCQQIVPQCIATVPDTLDCGDCEGEFMFAKSSSDGMCQLNSGAEDHCANYDLDKGQCLLCKKGFVHQSTLYPCTQFFNCSVNTEADCIICAPGFSYQENPSPQCQSHENTDIITNCRYVFSVDNSGTNFICLECLPGYDLVDDGAKKCIESDFNRNCIMNTSIGECYQCKNGYILNSTNQCVAANTYSENSQIYTNPYDQSFNKTQVLFKNQLQFRPRETLEKCTYLNLFSSVTPGCAKCSSPYYVNKNGNCIKLPEYCKEMNITGAPNPFCVQCNNPDLEVLQINDSSTTGCFLKSYFQTVQNVSLDYLSGCLQINSSHYCIKCKQGFVLFENLGKCKPAIINCARTTDGSTSSSYSCAECQGAYVLINEVKPTQCVPVSSKPNCLTIDSFGNCTSCSPGFFLKPSTEKANASCEQIYLYCNKGSKESNCLGCDERQIYNTNTRLCETRQQNITEFCSEYTTSNAFVNCLSCNGGSFIAQQHCDVANLSRCACDPGTQLCQCYNAAENCASVNGRVCASCRPGYLLTSSSTCYPRDHCVELDRSSTDIVCSLCKNGYAFNRDRSDCYQDYCQPIFAVVQPHCRKQNQTHCATCEQSYDLVDGICYPIVRNCKKFATSSLCEECDDYYYLDQSMTSCYLINFTKNCIAGNNTYCSKCKTRFAYTLDHKACKEIPDDHCDEGYWNETSFVCTKCIDQYYYQEFIKQCQLIKIYKCEQINFDDKNEQVCIKCKPGYFLYTAPGNKLPACIIGDIASIIPGCQKLATNFDYGINKCCQECLPEYYKQPALNRTDCHDCQKNASYTNGTTPSKQSTDALLMRLFPMFLSVIVTIVASLAAY